MGRLNNHREDANYEPASNEGKEVALWRLPPVGSHDQIVVNWHGLPFTRQSGFPVCMMLAQGVNDFNWGTVFHGGSCSSPSGYELSGSGTAATPITIQNTDASGNTYLEFWAYANRTPTSGEQETFPYDFSVEAPRHYLNLTISPFSEVAANGIVHASVTGATGLPAPDGLVYGLTVRWHEGGIATYTAASVGGQIVFRLALPESALKKSAGFIVPGPRCRIPSGRKPRGSGEGYGPCPATTIPGLQKGDSPLSHPVPPAPPPAGALPPCARDTQGNAGTSRSPGRRRTPQRSFQGSLGMRLRLLLSPQRGAPPR
ncbi:MAG: hypothetical protein H0X42_01315 [Solirubrobacterales bacterium]|nr:hypothetical protein [Solirubrobacterales bacterium]